MKKSPWGQYYGIYKPGENVIDWADMPEPIRAAFPADPNGFVFVAWATRWTASRDGHVVWQWNYPTEEARGEWVVT